MKEKITFLIKDFVKEYQNKKGISTEWDEAIVGFANANHPYILNLREIIGRTHALPCDVIKNAKTVICYYVPFTRQLAKTNITDNELASEQWALAYEETNEMFNKLNEYLIGEIKKMGYNAALASEASTFDRKKLKSNWSHRHFAYAAGLGSFGINNMLITQKGCCGRYNTIVSDIDVEHGEIIEEEYCLYKANGSCGICVKNCPMGALTENSYDRHLCYKLLQQNAEVYTEFGSSYIDESGENANSVGSEVCGKCVTASPCAFWKRK